MTPGGVFDGVLVVALEQAVAAPLCTARLAEAGARVIKVERAEGDFARGYDHVAHGESAYFVWLNRGKQSIALDIKSPVDAALLHRIIAGADVFIQNLLPGAAARAGFGTETLRARHPRLITCDITGYGESGPLADLKAYDFLIQCEAGLVSITGGADEPGRVGVSVADIGCGLNAYAAVVEALYRRERTGKGAALAVSLFDSLADWMAVPLLHQDYGGRAPARMGLRHATIAPYGAFQTQDGKTVVVAVQNEREWAVFCREVLESPVLAEDGRFAGNASRCAHRGALDGEIQAVLDGLTEAELLDRLRRFGVAFGRVNEVAALSTHPQLRRTECETPSGPVSLPASPARWRDRTAPVAEVPALNAHGDRIRAEFADPPGPHDDAP